MNLEELKLLRLVQGILVRNYVDTQRLDVQVIGHSVYVEGEFKVFEYHPSQERKKTRSNATSACGARLLHIEQQIRSLGEVTYLQLKICQLGAPRHAVGAQNTDFKRAGTTLNFSSANHTTGNCVS